MFPLFFFSGQVVAFSEVSNMIQSYNLCKNARTATFFQSRMTSINFLEQLFEIIKDRKLKQPAGSYTTSLFQEGVEKILAKGRRRIW